MRKWKTSQHFEANFNSDVILTSVTMTNEISLQESRWVQFICQQQSHQIIWKIHFCYIAEHLQYWHQCLHQCYHIDIPKVFCMKINSLFTTKVIKEMFWKLFCPETSTIPVASEKQCHKMLFSKYWRPVNSQKWLLKVRLFEKATPVFHITKNDFFLKYDMAKIWPWKCEFVFGGYHCFASDTTVACSPTRTVFAWVIHKQMFSLSIVSKLNSYYFWEIWISISGAFLKGSV